MRPPVDVPRLVEFSDGTTAGLRRLIELFVEDIRETADELWAAAASGGSAEIELLAHRAGGSSAACRAGRLAELLLQLEGLARDGDAKGAATLVPQARAELGRVTAFLVDHLDGMGTEL